jgi:exodeoxyribonuclease VII large subunit
MNVIKMKALTLYELNALVRETLELSMPNAYWVQAELAEVRERNGHCYMELVQMSPAKQLVAKASARCWRNTWQLLRPHFERLTGQQLHAGMSVMLQVYPQFHEAYGFSWIVSDINPEFTMGDMARKRQEIIRQLKEEGVYDLQKELTIPLFAKRIAVISSETAAGYGDFCNQLTDNAYGFRFQTELFPAVMQGEQVESSVIAALDHINERIADFDVVVIIRGGGATTDLSGFDTLLLAENVANFPLPIITGIGHDRDESVLDMISHTRVKTPTAAAAFLIDHLAQVYERIEDSQRALVNLVKRRMENEQMRLQRLSSTLPVIFSLVKTRGNARLERLQTNLLAAMQQRIRDSRNNLSTFNAQFAMLHSQFITRQRHRLQLIEEKVRNLDPVLLLNRGYSITLKDGKVVRDASQLKAGDEIETRLKKGNVKSIVK